MRLFEVAALAAWIINLALAFFVLAQDARARLHRAYAVWGVGVALTNLGAFFLYQATPEVSAIWWARLFDLGILIAPLGLHETARLISGQPPRPRWQRFFLALHALLVASLFTPWFIRSLQPLAFGWWPQPGPLSYVYLASNFFLMGRAILLLARASRTGTALHRTRLRALLGAIVLLLIAALNDVLPSFGVHHYPLLGVGFYPLGSFAACLYMVVVAYSVLQLVLLDAQRPLGRASAHLVRFGFLALSSLLLLFSFAAVVPGHFNDVSFAGAMLAQLLGAFVASVFFPRLFGHGAETMERKILGDQPAYGDEVRAFVQAMQSFGELPALVEELHRVLTWVLQVESYALHLRGVAGGFQLYRAFPDGTAEEEEELTIHCPIARFFEEVPITCLALASRGGVEDPTAEEARAQLGARRGALCFALYAQEEPIGFLLLGAKLSDDPFTVTDIQLLTSLANTLGLVVNQIRLTTQIRQGQEFELLGRMSSGLAHDLNNLLTPISTLLQLTEQTGQVDDELLPVASRNVAAIRSYIREGLFFSQHHRPDFHPARLNEIVERAAEVARSSRTTRVTIEKNFPGEVWAEVDAVLIQRLIANLLANAIDASPEESRIVVALETRTLEAGDWLRLCIIDQGAGIASADLPRVFTPYFTTKNRGDRKRGFGLGLAICRKIASLHGGELSVESELHRGTTVFFDLPARQNASQPVGASLTQRPPLPLPVPR